ncbi:MAG: hypothetical protein IKF42_11920 [Mogibacterium sp.]|nr:hypothetical protein [Mogibacterium sp.]
MSEKLLSALSMARGAGKLKIGLEASKEAVLGGAPLVVITNDTSGRTQRSIRECCTEDTEVIVLRETQQDVADKFGWKFGVAAITDRNFAELVRRSEEMLGEGLE